MNDLFPLGAFVYFLIFTRVGAILMLVPGIGERSVPQNVRLSIALLLTLVIAPSVAHQLPGLPESMLVMVSLILGEAFIGIFIGTIARLAFNALQVAGTVISFQSGLAYAQNFDPTQGQQGSVVGTFLAVLGVTMIFVTNTHHLMFIAATKSYELFQPGLLPPMSDVADFAVRTVSGSFLIGIQMASPFIVFGLVFYLAVGVLSKLMPQVQIFFIAMPANIMIGFVILSMVLSSIMLWFIEYYQNHLIQLVP